jgi:hypothetical protein
MEMAGLLSWMAVINVFGGLFGRRRSSVVCISGQMKATNAATINREHES